jgi:hypothetical protein
MPRQTDYPRWRYLTMQAVMWGVLVCTLGIAALASNFKRGASSVKLGEPLLLDSVTVRLPKGWRIVNDGANGVRATERTRDDPFRRTLFVRERDPENMTLLERWAHSNSSAAQRPPRGPTIPMGPTDGVVHVTRSEIDPRVEAQSINVMAVSSLPNGHTLTISVSCVDFDGTNEEAAMEVVKLVAESVEFVPAREPGK